MFRHPIILWCEDEWSPESLAGNIVLCSFDSTKTNLTSCFETSSTSGVQQKLRVCGSEEDEFILHFIILVTVIVTNCLSLAAALWLNKIKDYVELYRATRKFLWCIAPFPPFTPVVHRSAIFALATSGKDDALFEEIMDEAAKEGGNISQATITQLNSSGETPLEVVSKSNDWWKTLFLWCAGAKPAKDSVKSKSSEFLMEHAGLHPLGIQHVVECPALVP